MTETAKLEALITDIRELIRAAWTLCDNTGNENPPEVDQGDWNKLSAALDKLDQLPEVPDLVAGPATKAEYVLTRALSVSRPVVEGLEDVKAALIERVKKDGPLVAWEIEEVLSSLSPPTGGVSIDQLQAAHIERQEEWCPDQKPDLSFRGNEMGGECGEAQNVIKKLERERHGWRGSRDTVEHLGQELADVVHTAVLCAITAGIELGPYVVAKFNETSEKNGLSTFLPSPPEAE
ncbi:MazG-like family protein [Devosia epidermidihirudinis]|uniref:MazG-like family protein n=1 Tax=Devosia epidermidihirudinis TaxID=1293439 RepID=UPI0012E3B20A|nr:MazG-like family protein [Devosia epidermidihirudinis]